jgi:hypothetical protein
VKWDILNLLEELKRKASVDGTLFNMEEDIQDPTI